MAVGVRASRMAATCGAGWLACYLGLSGISSAAAGTGWQDQSEPPAAAAAANDAQEPAADTPAPQDAVEATGSPDKNVLRDISFDDLKFDIPIGTPFARQLLSPEVKKLDGQLIKIRGYMKPNFQQDNIEKFVLVRDNQACCFGPGAAIYDCVLVMLGTGKKTEFSVRPITVSGTMYLKEYKGPDGNIWAIFRMKNAVVE